MTIQEPTNSIFFSPEYVKALTEYAGFVGNVLPKENKHILMFVPEKYPDHVMISKMDLQIMTTLTAPNSHVRLPSPEIGYSNFPEFIKFLNSVGYPYEPNSKIERVEQTNSYGQKLRHAILSNTKSKYHIALGRPGLFSSENDKIVPMNAQQDPNKLIAQVSLSRYDVKEILGNIKLMGSPEEFAIKIEHGTIVIYVKDDSGDKQYSKTIEPQNVKFFDDFKPAKGKEIRMFSCMFFSAMGSFTGDYIMMIRLIEDRDIMLLKSYAYLDYPEDKAEKSEKKKSKTKLVSVTPPQDEQGDVPQKEKETVKKDNIGLFIGASQSQKHTGIKTFDVIGDGTPVNVPQIPVGQPTVQPAVQVESVHNGSAVASVQPTTAPTSPVIDTETDEEFEEPF